MKSTRHIHGAFWLIIAAMAFFVMASSSPQCARSSDRALSPGLEPLAADPIKVCQRACNATARLAIRVERKRHRLARKACNGNPGCLNQEDNLNEAILAEIEQDRLDCRDECTHEQGAARGGQ